MDSLGLSSVCCTLGIWAKAVDKPKTDGSTPATIKQYLPIRFLPVLGMMVKTDQA